MDFGANKTPVEVTNEGAFGGTYFEKTLKFDNILVNKKKFHKSK